VRHWRGIVITLFGIVAVALIVLAAFPWGVLRATVEARLSQDLGRPVTIRAIERGDRFSFTPLLRIRGVRIPGPAWAGTDDLLAIDDVQLRLPVFPLLLGDFRPSALDIRGMRTTLVRNAEGVESWNDKEKTNADKKGGRPNIRELTVRDAVVVYRDAKRGRSFTATLNVVAARGLRLKGTGDVRGHPVTLDARGGPITTAAYDQPWPFQAHIVGDALAVHFTGRMDRPLDIGHLTADARVRGNDLALVDAIIEAGLPGTQPVNLKAKVRRDSPDWTVTGLSGTIGRSDIAGHATIRKQDGRARIEGAIRSNRFDFNDLASDEGLRKGAAKRARFGERLIPDTAIDLRSVARTDGKLDIQVAHLLWPGSTPFRSLSTTLTLERSLLTLDPLRVGLGTGRMDGSLVVDQRNGGPVLKVRLGIAQARLVDFFRDAAIDGSLRGRVTLTGTGRTVRQAVARSNGAIVLVAQDGNIPARTASLLGQDVGRVLTTDKDVQATLRCLIVRLDVRDGIARTNPAIIDTSRAQTRVEGTIRFADERLMVALTGAPKHNSILRMSDPIPITGTIKKPDIQVPERVKTAKGVLGMIGDAITGKQTAIATDADCSGLAARALR
jgi:uncharacterized protein involved in outer membrane biogenesis